MDSPPLLDIFASPRGWLGPQATLARLLATRFQLDETDVLRELQQGSAVIERSVSPERAQEIQEVLARIGVACEQRPSAQTLSTQPPVSHNPHPNPSTSPPHTLTPHSIPTPSDRPSIADLMLPTAPPEPSFQPKPHTDNPTPPTSDASDPWAQVLGQPQRPTTPPTELQAPPQLIGLEHSAEHSKPETSDEHHIDLDAFSTHLNSSAPSDPFTHAQGAQTPFNIPPSPISPPSRPEPSEPEPFLPPPPPASKRSPSSPKPPPPSETPHKRNMALFAALVAALLVCVGGALWFAVTPDTESTKPAASAQDNQRIRARGQVAIAISKALYRAERDTREAEKTFRANNPAPKSDPFYGMTLQERQRKARQLTLSGRTACTQKRFEACEADLSKATELDPSNRDAWNALLEARQRMKAREKREQTEEPEVERGASLTDEIQRKLGQPESPPSPEEPTP